MGLAAGGTRAVRSGFGICDALEPNLAPKREDAARTEEAVLADAGLANHAVEDDAFAGQGHHAAGAFLDDAFDASANAKGPAAIGHHLGVEVRPRFLLRLFRVARISS